ncbi:membrane protein insertase YidC [bacterium]|nr:membrane protein insertase YidC [bacterium]
MAARTWVAITLCFGIWFVYMKWFAPLPPTSVETPAQVQGKQGEAPAVPAPSVGGTAVSSAPWKADVKLENSKISLSFSDAGGKPVEATTKRYRVTPKKSSGPMPVLSVDQNGAALETLFTDSQLVDLSSAQYERKAQDNGLIFSAANKHSAVEKSYQLKEGTYFLEGNIRIAPKDPKKTDWGYLLIPVGARAAEADTHDPLKSWEVVAYQNEKLSRTPIAKIEAVEKVEQGDTAWIAYGNKYFAMAVSNPGGSINPDVVLTKQAQFVGAYLRYPLRLKEGQKEISIPVRFYLGAKDYNELEGARMLGLIDYGFFAKLAFPLLWLLRAFYSVIHNYGVAIILLTVLVRVLFYPLTLKSQKSMKAMQRLQPQINALKEKYKDNPTKMQTEQMALFKTHKVNPMGGCVPMLVQLPVFIALYAVLGNSIELFQAPFFGWIQDLSTKDPYYIYPVLMGISMFVQQKLTPAVGMDPAQQKVMMFMPVLFSFMMINLPSGLTMYIFVSTLLGILQQVMMKDKNTASSPAPVISNP